MALILDENRQRPSGLSLGLNLVGIVGVTYWAIAAGIRAEPSTPVWTWWIGGIAIGTWLLRTVVVLAISPPPTRGWTRWLLEGTQWAMVIAGSFAASTLNSLTIVPALVAVVVVTADLTRPLGLGLAHAAVAAVAIAFGAVPFDFPIWGIIGLEAGLTVAVLVGISRRQFRANEAQSRLLRERDLTVRQERDRLQLLADRQAAARDIHDVLAHSLGGLVIQLDAVEALLEAGDVDGAARRVSDARALAASGLDDARRAVVALRDEPTPNDAVPVVTEPLASSLGALIDAHRAFGGTAEFTMAGEERPLDAPAATALRRALQESLSNARKHATGEPVSVRLVWTGTDVTLTVENRMNDLLVARQAGAGAGARTGAVAAAGARARAGTGMLASTGGGHGLSGMRERFAELPNGGTVRAEADGSRFVVVAEAKLA